MNFPIYLSSAHHLQMYLQGTEVTTLAEDVLVLKAAAQNDENQLRCARCSFEILTGESTRTFRYAGRYCQTQWLFSPVAPLSSYRRILHIFFVRWLNINKSGGVKFGELAGQTVGPPRRIKSLGNILFRYSGASRPKWAGALPYRPHVSLHTTSGIFPSNSGKLCSKTGGK
jgi:hypothetical protein